jgi:hypothetical protein
MVITPHMLVGAAIGTQAPNGWSVFILGLVSHYLLDFLPHWDYLYRVDIKNPSHRKKIALDFLLGAGLILILTWSYPDKWLIIIGIGAALLPDFLEVIYKNFKINWLRPLARFHEKIHWNHLAFWPGLPSLLIVSLIAIFLIL